MATLTVRQTRHEVGGETQTLHSAFGRFVAHRDIWFRTDKGPINTTSEPFLPVALIPAMRKGWNLQITGQVSPTLMEGAEQIQRVMCGWYRDFHHVNIQADKGQWASRQGPPAVAAFFSGGVDSFFTLMKHHGEITHLVFVHGFDIRLKDKSRRLEMADNARRVAEQLNLKLVEVETNLRDFGRRHRVGWGEAYFGAGLAAVALLLAPRFNRIYVPASIAYEHLIPVGSHPDLDRHWGNGQIAIIHDGAEFDRFEKIKAIADWPLVANHLRVCYGFHHTGLNCGRCGKCLWTMFVLEAVGRLDAIRSLPSRIDLEAVRMTPPPHEEHQRIRFVKSIAHLEVSGRNPELCAVLKELLAKGAEETAAKKADSPWKAPVKHWQRWLGKR